VSTDVAIPSIDTLRQIVVGDDQEDYEALTPESKVASTATGDIEYGIVFTMHRRATVNRVRRVRDAHLYDLSQTVVLNPGDQLVVTHDMFCPHDCDS